MIEHSVTKQTATHHAQIFKIARRDLCFMVCAGARRGAQTVFFLGWASIFNYGALYFRRWTDQAPVAKQN
jgi:hypothetical protein